MGKAETRESISGYALEEPFQNLGGNASWTFAEKDGKNWFVKRFYDPVWPMNPEHLDPKRVERSRERCVRFYNNKRKFYDAVNACGNGNIVTIHDFFRWESHYYVVTERIPAADFDMTYVSERPTEVKLVLLKVLASNFLRLHEKGIVYADLCPDNVLLKKTATGSITAKLIDFDGSFFENDPPKNGGLPIRDGYISPETADIYYNEIDHIVTRKVDVFTLGLMFHLYWTGALPTFNTEKYPCVGAAVLEGEKPTVDGAIPEKLRLLIERMLSREPADRPDMVEVFHCLKDDLEAKTEKELDSSAKTELVAPSFWSVPSDV